MATAIKMPDLGTTVDTVTLVKWLKNEGDTVERGEPLCEIQTDKAVNEVESIAKGVLLRQEVTEGSEIQQGTTIAYVGKEGETIDDGEAVQPVEAETVKVEIKTAVEKSGSVKISPMLRNLAKRKGVDVSKVHGSGPGGKITRDDIMQAQDTAPDEKGEPLSPGQRSVARQVAQSQREIPAIDLVAQIDMSAVTTLRTKLKEDSGQKISYDAIFVSAVAKAVKEFPHFRSSLVNENVICGDTANVGVAISFDHELFIPVIKGAANKTIPEIDAELQNLVEKAQQNKLTLDEMTGATITVSNLGMFQVKSFKMIVPPDQIAALSIGSTQALSVIEANESSIIQASLVTLSTDHRLINGREAAEFLTRLKEILETL